jgi:uncharacterized membrane protein YebE (DUF533 family)
VDNIKQFIEQNKDWLIQVGGAVAVLILAPSLLGRKKIGKIVQFAAFGYGAYVVYKNWDRIKSGLKLG